MRILVLLDPTNKYGTKREYTELREFLRADGYLRIGNEMFMRVTMSRNTAKKHKARLAGHRPGTGIVRIIELTEKQYKNIWYLTGDDGIQEKIVGSNSHISL